MRHAHIYSFYDNFPSTHDSHYTTPSFQATYAAYNALNRSCGDATCACLASCGAHWAARIYKSTRRETTMRPDVNDARRL